MTFIDDDILSPAAVFSLSALSLLLAKPVNSDNGRHHGEEGRLRWRKSGLSLTSGRRHEKPSETQA